MALLYLCYFSDLTLVEGFLAVAIAVGLKLADTIPLVKFQSLHCY
jgi:hypothetical protein